MENFVLTANAVLPLFLIMALGYGIRRTPLMDDHTHQMMNKLIFKLFLPILLFKNISTSDLNALSGSWVYLYALVSELAIFLILFSNRAAHREGEPPPRRAYPGDGARQLCAVRPAAGGTFVPGRGRSGRVHAGCGIDTCVQRDERGRAGGLSRRQGGRKEDIEGHSH